MPPSGSDSEQTMVEDYLDCTGAVRTFRLELYAYGAFLSATEVRNGVASGWRFVLPASDGRVPWGEMRARIRKHLARRNIARHPDGRLEMLTSTIRAQLTDTPTDQGSCPGLLVDDLELTWDELGELLASCTGFHLKIEVQDSTEG